MKLMSAALILHERIETTDKKGKLVRSNVEKLITKGKSENLHQRRQIFSALPKNAAKKVYEVLGPKYKDRKGGYTRILKLGKMKDGTTKVSVEFV